MIPITQYLLPDGRTRSVFIEVSARHNDLAAQLIKKGAHFDVEILTTGEVSMTCEMDELDDPCLAIRVVRNGPGMREHFESMIEEASTARAKDDSSDTNAAIIDKEFAALRAQNQIMAAELRKLDRDDIVLVDKQDLAALRARLATAEGYLLGLTDDAAWANHKDCICGDCELLRDIRAFLAEAGEGEK